jgi:nucleoid DNA-binding protein
MAAKKATAKKKATKKVASPAMKAPAIKDALTKGGIVRTIADMTGSSKKDAATFIQALTTVIESHVKTRGPGKFVFPGLLKITVVKKPARAARKGINPFTGEETTFKAKPAHKVVKIKPLKPLKEKVTE